MVVLLSCNALDLCGFGNSLRYSLSKSARDKIHLLSPSKKLMCFFAPYLCLNFNAPPICHSQYVDCHVYDDVLDNNLFSSRFTQDMGNATPLMGTRPHPGNLSRVEWEMGWRSCWISSRTNICPSGERQVSFQTICPM